MLQELQAKKNEQSQFNAQPQQGFQFNMQQQQKSFDIEIDKTQKIIEKLDKNIEDLMIKKDSLKEKLKDDISTITENKQKIKKEINDIFDEKINKIKDINDLLISIKNFEEKTKKTIYEELIKKLLDSQIVDDKIKDDYKKIIKKYDDANKELLKTK